MPGKFFYIILLFCMSGYYTSHSQTNSDNYRIEVYKAKSKVKLDGIPDEEAWSQAQVADNFVQHFPNPGDDATSPTRVMFTFDDTHLYIGGICQNNSDKDYVISSLKRDFDWSSSDNLHIYFDTFNDYTNGFAFGITPKGVQREGLISEGQDVNTDWDNKWYSEAVEGNGQWTFEMAIPFKTLRYNASKRDWNFVVLRLDLANNERTLWAPIPIEYRPSNLSFGARLHFADPLPKAGTNISLIPYVAGGISRDFSNGEDPVSTSGLGFDAKVGITSGLNLDLTVNPDFSQVEVDRQVTNLTRFELFFPERRQFFLENRDLFDKNGFPKSRPFFSRRIGLASNNGLTQQIPILYGARLSGKINNNVRIGILNSQTAESPNLDLPGQNFSVGIIQKKIFARSNISFLIVNKENIGVRLQDSLKYNFNSSIFKTKTIDDQEEVYLNKYNRVFGVDYNLFSADNKWEANMFYHRSFRPEVEWEDSYSTGGFLGYTVRAFSTGIYAASVGTNFDAEVGFVPRKNITELGTFNSYSFWPENSLLINTHGPQFNASYTSDNDFNTTDFQYSLGYNITFLNTMEMSGFFRQIYQFLRNDFYPTSEDTPLPAGSEYFWSRYGIELNSDTRKLFSAEFEITTGGFYTGTLTNLNTELNYRVQPYGSISLTADYNDIQLPKPYSNAGILLIGPKLDITFSRKLFLTTFVQYNEQADNVNINSRFQWRFKPASDLFIVYTDNYIPNSFIVKNRGIIAKFTYWLNL